MTIVRDPSMTVIEVEHRVRTAATGGDGRAPLSRRVLEVAVMFGLGVDEERELEIIPRSMVPLPRGGIVFITGPSGGGKSTLLRLIAARCLALGRRVIDVAQLSPPRDEPLVDQVGLSVQDACSMLALAGLGDAFVMMRRPAELSDGQRHRFALCRALEAASVDAGGDGAIILADELGATLDRLTARALGTAIRKWMARTPHTFIAATTYDDLLEALAPGVLIVKRLGGRIEVAAKRSAGSGLVVGAGDAAHQRREHEVQDQRSDGAGDDDCNDDPDEESNAPSIAGPRQQRAGRGGRRGGPVASGSVHDEIILEPGTAADYRALAEFHYRSHHVGAVTSVVRAVIAMPSILERFAERDERPRRDEPAREVVGVLVRSLPHLGCALRDHATGGRYRGMNRRDAARMLNREVRTISRVVIDPRFRGLGLAVRLVRHALGHPEPGAIFTEALAAMGRVHPFFERAGMTRYDRPPPEEQSRLIEALARLGIEAVMLASTRAVKSMIAVRSGSEQRWIERELRRWAGRAGAARSRLHQDASMDDLLAAARDRLLSQPVYYLFHHGKAKAGAVERPRDDLRMPP
jgi:hypothetical protein